MRNIKYTHEEYTALLSDRHINPIEPYSGSHTHIKHKCLVCQHIWTAVPAAVRQGGGCPNCYRRSVSKPLAEVVSQLAEVNWSLVDESQYLNSDKSPSQALMLFKHSCGNIIESNLERVLPGRCRCLQCKPRVIKSNWSEPVSVNGRYYYSKVEMECCEYLVEKFGADDIILHKLYGVSSKQASDAYIISLDTYVEISSINKPWYHERIYRKRKLVDNFVFVASVDQLKLFFP